MLKLLPKFTGARQCGRIKAVGNALHYAGRVLVALLGRVRDAPGQGQVNVRRIEPSEVARYLLQVLVRSRQADDQAGQAPAYLAS